MLRVRDLWKKYREEGPWVLSGASLEAGPGSMIWIVGSNGSGKTTLLRIIAGLTLPTRGSVEISGMPPRSPEARRMMGVVLHRSFLYDELSVRENLEYYAVLYGVEDYDPESDSIVEMLGLRKYLDRRASELSYGWRRRADMARALLHKPKILLVDEPFTGLDPRGVRDLREILQEIPAQRSILIMTSPRPEDTRLIPEATVYTLRGGRLVGQAQHTGS